MYYIYLYKLPYSRDIHTHFTNTTAENKYLKDYQLNTTPIQCDRIFNPNAKSFNINLKDYPRPKLITYMIIVDNSNSEFYYYYVNNFNVLSGSTVELFVESDDYHTYFNNRGGDINFSGILNQSNTNAVKPLYPTSDPFTLKTTEGFFTNSNLVPVVYLYVKNVGTVVIRQNQIYSDSTSIVSILTEALSADNVEVYDDNILLYTSQFTVFSAYGIPRELIKENTAPEITYKFKYRDSTYTFYFVGGLSVTKTFTPPNNTSNFFGTPFNKINIGNNKIVNLKAEFISLNNVPTLLLSVNNSNFLNVIDDFSITINYSEFSQYVAQNKMSSALSAISAGVGITKGILTGNFSQIGGGLLSMGAMLSGEQQARERDNTIINANMGNLVTTYAIYNKYGISIQSYETRYQEKLNNSFLIFGGDCENAKVSFENITDSDINSGVVSKTYYYQFSVIRTAGINFNKVENMFKNGIFIKFNDRQS